MENPNELEKKEDPKTTLFLLPSMPTDKEINEFVKALKGTAAKENEL